MNSLRIATLLALAALLLAACPKSPEDAPAVDARAGEPAAAITNRIDIPPAVVRNLGITFTQVERRHVAETLRVPGRFESPPQAWREYRSMLAGRVELLVEQYQTVEEGAPLFSLEAPEWRRMQEELDAAQAEAQALHGEASVARAEEKEASAALDLLPAKLEAIEPIVEASKNHSALLEDARDLWQARVTELEELAERGAGKAGDLAAARASLSDALTALSEEEEKRAGLAVERTNLQIAAKEAELRLEVLREKTAAAQTRAQAAEKTAALKLKAAAAAVGLPLEELSESEAWREIDRIVVKASGAGVVESIDLTDGAWIETNSTVLRTLDTTRLRFRAEALQSDLGRLKDGLTAIVAPPVGGSLTNGGEMKGVLRIAPSADPHERTVSLLMVPETLAGWARPGVSGHLEVVLDSTREPELAIPLSCVLQDGLEKIFFVRDPDNPDKVIRTVADLGLDDGRWVVVYSGVMAGSEVVRDGAFELMLTGSGKAAKGGHFHADGTWHEGADH